MSAKSPQGKKDSVIPGYKGHIPLVNVNNEYLSKRKTEQARDVLKTDVVDAPKNRFATTGFNSKLIPRDD